MTLVSVLDFGNSNAGYSPDYESGSGMIRGSDGYLYGMLRKLHLSQMRRESRSRIQPHFLVEYDSAETGLHMIDPRDRLQAQEELRRW